MNAQADRKGIIVELPAKWMFMSDAEIRQWQKERRAAKGEPEPETMEEFGRRMALEHASSTLFSIRGLPPPAPPASP